MVRTLLTVAVLLLAFAPAGVAAGVWLAVNPGTGIAAGSGLYGLLGGWLLTADLLPTPPREAVR